MLSLIWAVLAVLPASIATSEYSHSKHHRRQQQGGEAFQLEELKQGYEAEVRQTFNARCNENNVIRRKEWCVNSKWKPRGIVGGVLADLFLFFSTGGTCRLLSDKITFVPRGV